ncbi:MAG TPA: hypothetical protein VM140_04555 [Burkholderiales bacterium]|nr:hypothetical protein [Burkholderiales bacterium]
MRNLIRTLVAAVAATMMPAADAADAFAPAGAKATLTVDYVYESTGKKRSEGMYDPYEWRVKRTLNLVAELAAQPVSALPTVQAVDASQMAALKDKTRRAQAVQTDMAPVMADVEKIMAKCGDNEACISRESQKLGAAMRGTPKMDAAMNAKKDMQALGTPDAPRYQAWRATAQKGSYLIDETVHVSVPDPLCSNRPRQRCTRDEVRKGSGEVTVPRDAKNPGVAAGIAAVEVDTGKNTLTLRLPVPLLALPYTETITTDEPSRSEDPKGPQKKRHNFRVGSDKPLTVALKGGWRSQSGEQVVPLKGEFGDTGNLTVRWRFNVQ